MGTLTESRAAARQRDRRIRRALRQMDRLSRPGRQRPHRQASGKKRWTNVALNGAWLVALCVAITTVPVLPKEPLGQAPAAGTGGGSHAFQYAASGGTPVTYDPCRAIPYQVEDELGVAPAGAGQVVTAAVEEVSKATGLVFEQVEVGEEQPAPWFGLMPGTMKRESARIVWTHEGEHEDLAGQVLGHAGSAAVMEMGGNAQLTAGRVHLNGPLLSDLMQGRPDGEALVQAVVMHELAHMVGLGHVSDPGELMYPVMTGQTSWGPGDREGLALAGSGECHVRRPLVDVGGVVEVVTSHLDK